MGQLKIPLYLVVGGRGTYSSAYWYETDVTRFIRYHCNGKNEPLAEFD